MKTLKECPHCHSENIKKYGFFIRKIDRRKIQRYFCFKCEKFFSNQTVSNTYYQKRPDLNADILENISEGVGIRRSALNLRTSKTTIQRKIKVMAEVCDKFHKAHLDKWHCEVDPEFQFDEMDTFEKSQVHKIKVPVIVEKRSYFIVDATPMDASSQAHAPIVKKSITTLTKKSSRKDQRLLRRL